MQFLPSVCCASLLSCPPPDKTFVQGSSSPCLSSNAQDAALDAVRERTDLNLMAEGSLLGAWATIIAQLCTKGAMMQVRAVAPLTLIM